MPVALTSTSTSPAFGPSRSTVSMRQRRAGLPGDCGSGLHAIGAFSAMVAASWPVPAAGAAADQVGGLLGDHDRRRVGVAADERRHDRGVDDAQALRCRARAARRRRRRVGPGPMRQLPDRVVLGVGVVADELLDLRVALRRRRGRPSRGRRGAPAPAAAGCGAAAWKPRTRPSRSARSAQEGRVDQRRRERIGAGQADAAAARRPQQADVARVAVAEARSCGRGRRAWRRRDAAAGRGAAPRGGCG